MTDSEKIHTEPLRPASSPADSVTVAPDHVTAGAATGAPQTDAPAADTAARPTRPAMCTAAFIVTILAWICLPLWYPGALVGGMAGVVLSVLALRQRRGGWRNLALVSIVASSVLLLVLAVFWTALLITLTQL